MAGVKRQDGLNEEEMCVECMQVRMRLIETEPTISTTTSADASMCSEPNLLRGQAAMITVIDMSKIRFDDDRGTKDRVKMRWSLYVRRRL